MGMVVGSRAHLAQSAIAQRAWCVHHTACTAPCSFSRVDARLYVSFEGFPGHLRVSNVRMCSVVGTAMCSCMASMWSCC